MRHFVSNINTDSPPPQKTQKYKGKHLNHTYSFVKTLISGLKATQP